jgi:hypothetical protein
MGSVMTCDAAAGSRMGRVIACWASEESSTIRGADEACGA